MPNLGKKFNQPPPEARKGAWRGPPGDKVCDKLDSEMKVDTRNQMIKNFIKTRSLQGGKRRTTGCSKTREEAGGKKTDRRGSGGKGPVK